MEKILFALDIDDGWPPIGTESVWCEKVGNNYQLKNIPFFIPVIALDDIFYAELDPVNEHVFEFEVIEKSGRSVVWFLNNDELDISKFKEQLAQLSCDTEEFPRFSLGSIDVPADVDFDKLEGLLDCYESKGLDFAYPVWRKQDN